MTSFSTAVLFLVKIILMPSAYSELLLFLFAYLLIMFFPGLLIAVTFWWLEKSSEQDIASRCGGLQYDGYLIGYMERS
jgi:hypothetical protein